jgi:hypothetical protein
MRRSPLLAARLSFASATLGACAFLCVTAVPGLAFAQAASPAPGAKPAGGAGQTGKAKPGVAVADANAPKAPLPPLVSPPPPPPWTSPAPPTTNTSGATLLPESSEPTTAAPVAAPSSLSSDDRATLEGRLRMIEARLAADENALVNLPELSWLRRFHVSGFIQPQLLIQSYNTAASPNLINGALPPGVSANDAIAKSNGTTTNGDYFRLRRARLRTEFMPTEGTRLVFEFDPTPAGGQIGGTGTIARTVEAQGIARWSDYVTTELAAGIFKVPFGREILQSDADRPFIERSWGEQNLFPGEFDTGARAYTTWSRDDRTFAAQVAVVNGQTEGEPTFSLDPDLNQGKDFVGRLNFDFGDWVDVGASGYVGYGQVVSTAALRFKQFTRSAANVELGLHHTFSPKVGATRLFAEVTFAQNLDRGVHYAFALPAIPTNINAPVVSLNERAIWVRLEQDLSRWFTLGVRWDEYTPDTSLGNNARDTFGAVAVFHFTPWLQAMLEYDHAIDHVHQSGKQETDQQIEIGSGVLQARF